MKLNKIDKKIKNISKQLDYLRQTKQVDPIYDSHYLLNCYNKLVIEGKKDKVLKAWNSSLKDLKDYKGRDFRLLQYSFLKIYNLPFKFVKRRKGKVFLKIPTFIPYQTQLRRANKLFLLPLKDGSKEVLSKGLFKLWDSILKDLPPLKRSFLFAKRFNLAKKKLFRIKKFLNIRNISKKKKKKILKHYHLTVKENLYFEEKVKSFQKGLNFSSNYYFKRLMLNYGLGAYNAGYIRLLKRRKR